MSRVTAAVLLLAIAAATSAEERSATGAESAPRPDRRLVPGLSFALDAPAIARDTATEAPARDPAARRPCPTDWCQCRVDVPGLELSRARISRPELVATILDDADLAPLASLVWLFARTGVEVDWRPAQLEASGATASSGRGSLMVWLKLRMDAWGRPSFPERAQRPARLSST